MTKKFIPTKLKLIRPVPSDIEIAQESDIKPISQIAEEIGALPEEQKFYGPYKAKVKLEILERRLKAGEFVVACEIAPPLSVSTNKLTSNIDLVKSYVTVINFTENASATPRMTSWACSKIAIERGAEPVMQIAARDRTRAGLQGEPLGASALGVRNVLCVTGDSPVLAPQPRGRMDINDLDGIQMLWILRRIRDEGYYLDGREIKFPPSSSWGQQLRRLHLTPNSRPCASTRRSTPGHNSSRLTWSTTSSAWRSGSTNSPSGTSWTRSTSWSVSPR